MIWIVGPDYHEARREFRIIRDDIVLKAGLPLAVDRDSPDQGVMRLQTPEACGGSVLEVISERNPKKLEAHEPDAILMVEASQMKKGTWERLQGRRRLGHVPMYYGYTPEGYDWTYECLWQAALDGEEGYWARRGPSWENPAVSRDWLAKMKRRLSPEMYEAKIEGRFRTSTGFVFSTFDPGVHVADLTRNEHSPLYAAVDYGYTNPTVVLDVQVNEHDQVLVLAEYYVSNRTSVEHAQIVAAWEKGYARMFDDPSGKDAHEIWKHEGLPVEAVACEVETGNELIAELLKVRDDGKPGLLIDRSCTNMIREMTRYRYGPTREQAERKEAPMKVDDHTPEALKRFVAWHMGLIQTVGVLKLATTMDARTFQRERMGNDSLV